MNPYIMMLLMIATGICIGVALERVLQEKYGIKRAIERKQMATKNGV